MSKSIFITGVAWTWKSTICEELKNRWYKAFDIEKIKWLFFIRNKLTWKIVNYYENNNIEFINAHDWVCDIKKMKKIINKNNLSFYCWTSSNINKLLDLFDKIFLLKVWNVELRSRLNNRGWFACCNNIQEWMFWWKNEWELEINKKWAIDIDANKNISYIVDNILEKIVFMWK